MGGDSNSQMGPADDSNQSPILAGIAHQNSLE